MREFLVENYVFWTIPMGILLGVSIHRIVLGIADIISDRVENR
jgi:hypothetical protein